MSRASSPEEQQRRMERIAAGLGVVAFAAGTLKGVDFGLGILAGAILAFLNYGLIGWMVDRYVGENPRRGSWLPVIGFGLRYTLLGLALYVIFALWHVNVVAVSLGLSIPVAAIFVEWGIEAREGLSPEGESLGAPVVPDGDEPRPSFQKDR